MCLNLLPWCGDLWGTICATISRDACAIGFFCFAPHNVHHRVAPVAAIRPGWIGF